MINNNAMIAVLWRIDCSGDGFIDCSGDGFENGAMSQMGFKQDPFTVGKLYKS